MISASKTTYSHYNLKILRPKVKKNIKNLHKKFCEFPPRYLSLVAFFLVTVVLIIDAYRHTRIDNFFLIIMVLVFTTILVYI